MNPFTYNAIEPRFNLRLHRETDKWSHYAMDFPSAFPGSYEEYRTVRGEYYQPKNAGKAPLAILLHGMGERGAIPCEIMARDLVRKGVACFILYLFVHANRTPEIIKKRKHELTAEEWFEGYQLSVIDVRQVLDWAPTRPEIDAARVTVMGISFGGFISTIAMGVDRRIKAGVILVSGGNSEKIGHDSRILRKRNGYGRSEAEYQNFLKCYHRYLAEVAEKGVENVVPAQKSFLIDPMTYAYLLRQRPLLMVNALWDEFIPRQSTLDLWQACDKPDIAWFPATHASIWLWYPLIRRKFMRFSRKCFPR